MTSFAEIGHTTVDRARVVFGTAGAQILVQALGLLAGLAVVRGLAPIEYAAYTVANAAIGALIAISDSGVAAGVLSQGGRIWQDRVALGSVLVTGQRLRRRMLPAAFAIAAGFVTWVTMRLGLGLLPSLLIALAGLPALWLTTQTQMLEVVPRLQQDIGRLQRLQVSNGLGRLLLVVALLPLAPWAAIAIAAAALPQAWCVWRLRRLAARYADLDSPPNAAVDAVLRRQVRRTMPAVIYFAISGQLSIGLVSLLGTARQVASVGALGRLTMLLVALSAAFGVLVVPRFARLDDRDPSRVLRFFWLAQAALFLAGLGVVGLVAIFRSQVVWILGPNYAGLEREAVLMAGTGVLWAMAGGALNLVGVRGIVTPPWFIIPVSLTVEVSAILVLPVGTVLGAIEFGAAAAFVQWALHASHFHWLLARRRSVGGPP